MNVNDTVPVTIAGQVVAQATVKELGNGTATLVVPATLVVMATRTELTAPEPVEASDVESGAEHQILGIDRTSGESAEVTPVEAPAEAPVETPAPVENVAPVETPVVEAPAAPVEVAPVEAPVETNNEHTTTE